MFLMGFVILLSIQLIFPLLRSLSRDAGRERLIRTSTDFLRQLRQDFRLSAMPGVNHHIQGQDWTLALVARDWPAKDGTTIWSKSLILYHYSSQQKLLWRKTVTQDLWPANQTRLDGKEPPVLQPEAFLPIVSPDSEQGSVVSLWPSLQSQLEVKIQAEGIAPILLSLDLTGDLKTP